MLKVPYTHFQVNIRTYQHYENLIIANLQLAKFYLYRKSCIFRSCGALDMVLSHDISNVL